MARLVLVGLPGVGKSDVGAAVAARWGCAALDTDDVLSRMVGCSAGDYLRSQGEEQFRHMELLALEESLHRDAVVATGAGVVTLDGARDLLRSEPTIWLDCPDDVIGPRVRGGDRPLLGDDAQSALARLRGEREQWYLDVSRTRVDASGTLDDVTKRVLQAAGEVKQ